MNKIAKWLTAVALLSGPLAVSAQQPIGIQFVGEGTPMGGGEVAGVVAQSNWNPANGTSSAAPLILMDQTGASSGATVTWNTNGMYAEPISNTPGNDRLMLGYLDTVGGVTTVAVAGLPASSGGYNVYVYAEGANGGGTRTGDYQISGSGITTTSVNLSQVGSTDFTGTFTQANNSVGNYVVFSISSAATGFTITATPGATTDIPRAPLNAIQIVPQGAANTYTLGGSISGLTSAGLVLANNGATLAVNSGASSFTFGTSFSAGTAYSVTVSTQPSGLSCSVANGSGTMPAADVTNVAVTCAVNSTSAAAIGIQFVGDGTPMGSSEVAGVVSQSNWNPESGAGSTTPLLLMDQTGAGTAATVTWNTNGIWSEPISNSPGNDRLMLGYLDTTGGPTTVTVAGLLANAGGYNVYVYAEGANGGGTRTGAYQIRGSGITTTSVNLSQVGSTDFTGTFTQANNSAGNYVVLPISSGATGFTITATPGATTDIPRAPLNAIQIVPQGTIATYTLGGMISGLTSSGLLLANNGVTLAVNSGASSFTFGTAISAGTAYSVTVSTQPTGLTCSIANGSGTMPAANVTNVAVTCTANPTYTLGGTISGLTSAGLVLANGGSLLTVSSGASNFTFGTSLSVGTAYSVTVSIQPTGLTCSIANGSGTMPAANVTNVAVTCTANPSYTLGGTISGLTASGLVLANGGQTLAVSTGATGFTFGTGLISGTAYAVTVSTEPSGLICTIANGSGTMPAANVTTVSVTCSANPTYTLGGTISGLTASGLVLANAGATISISSGASSFTFGAALSAGTAYAVTMSMQPGGLTCSIANGSGTMPAANVTTVVVTCTASGANAAEIGIQFVGEGTAMGSAEVAGVVAQSNWNAESGTSSAAPLGLVNQLGANSGATVTWNTNGIWEEPISNTPGDDRMMLGYLDTVGGVTTVTVAGLPSSAGGYNIYVYAEGDNGNANRTAAYQISGKGITTTSVNLTDAAYTFFNGTFTRANNSAGNYVVFPISSATTGFTITATPGATTDIPRAPLNAIQIVPQGGANTYTLGGTISGLTANGLVLANAGQPLTISSSASSFTFGTALSAGTAYAVTVSTQPSGLSCTVANGSGTMPAANVTNISVTCSASPTYTLGGTISGLSASGLVLANGGVTLNIGSYTSSFTFSMPLSAGTAYAVTVSSQPSGLSCSIANGSGTMPAADVTSVTVTCTASGVNAAAIGIQFVGDGTAMASTEVAGVVAQSNWNPESGTSSAAPMVLMDQTGASSGATVTWNTDGIFAEPISNTPGDNRMMLGYLDTLGAGTTVRVVGLPINAGGYNVYVYAEGANGGDSRTGAYQISGNGITTTSVNLTDAAYTFFDGTFTEGNNTAGNYVLFSIGSAATGFTITATPVATTDVLLRAPVNAIQIVPLGIATYTLGGSISGLTSAGLVLANNGAVLAVDSGATSFTFGPGLSAGSAYSITVATQPSGLSCSITNGSGRMPADNVTNVAVTCSASGTYTLGGTISGLTSAGLVLANNGAMLAVDSGATSFTFGTALSVGTAYSVKVATKPAGLSCLVANGSNTMPAANVTNVAVTCSVDAVNTAAIGIQFVGEGAAMDSTEVAGVVAQSNWNPASGASSAAPFLLMDQTGANSGATVTWNADGIDYEPISNTPGNDRLMLGDLDTVGGVTTVTVAGLPSSAAGYNVYVYAEGENCCATRTAAYQISGTGIVTTSVDLIDAAGAFNGTFTPAINSAGNYVVFSISSAATGFTITATPIASTDMYLRASLNAIQIVPANPPAAIGIQFVGQGTAMGSTEAAGVVAQPNWNPESGMSSAALLVDQNGATSGAAVIWNTNGIWSEPISNSPGNDRLMLGYLDTTGGPTAVTVAGLPTGASGYNVYVYAAGDNGGSTRTGAYQISGSGITTTSVNLIDAAHTLFNGHFTQAANSAGNYVMFPISAAATGFTITATPGATTDIPRAPLNAIQIVPQGNIYTLGGTISGLTASGLVLANGGDMLTVSSGASTLTFATALTAGSAYSVTVSTQPTGLTCLVSNGSGTMPAANVTSVAVSCTPNPTYTLGGTISGLTAGGLVLANGGDMLTVSSGASTLTFATALTAGSAYSVTVSTQPTGLTCLVSNGSGTMPAANVTSVAVSCTPNPTYTLGGTISGLTASGLVLANGGDMLTVSSGASTLTFATALTAGSAYSVTVSTQPTGLTCLVSNGSGTMPAANVTSVAVSCTPNPTYTLGGTISGLTAGGLVLANGGDMLTVSSGASTLTFATALTAGSAYSVTVSTQPTGLTCLVSNGSGTMPAANVTSVAVSCTPNPTYTLGGTISGLTAGGLVLANGGDMLTVSSGASTLTFATALTAGSAYSVTVSTQPTGLTCLVSNGSGTMPAANVTSVAVSCTPNPTYTLGGTISGLTAGGLVLANGGDMLTVSSGASSFTFGAALSAGTAYAVIVSTQPTGLTCMVANGSDTMPAANVTSVAVSCTLPL